MNAVGLSKVIVFVLMNDVKLSNVGDRSCTDE
jgi:hypothetical protein